MKVICILQNAWGWGGYNELPPIFRPNPLNKSAKTIKKICDENPYYFCNTTGVITEKACEGSPIDKNHFNGIIKRLVSFDVILVCGNQAKKAVLDEIKKFELLGKPVIFIPHPASRSLKNVTLSKANKILNKAILNKFSKIAVNND